MLFNPMEFSVEKRGLRPASSGPLPSTHPKTHMQNKKQDKVEAGKIYL